MMATNTTNLLNQQFTVLVSNHKSFSIFLKVKIFHVSWKYLIIECLVPDRTFPPSFLWKAGWELKLISSNFLVQEESWRSSGGILTRLGLQHWKNYTETLQEEGSCQYWTARRTKEIWGDFQTDWALSTMVDRIESPQFRLPTWQQIWKAESSFLL